MLKNGATPPPRKTESSSNPKHVQNMPNGVESLNQPRHKDNVVFSQEFKQTLYESFAEKLI